MSSRSNKAVRRLERIIKPFGLRIENGDHRRIVNGGGQAIYWFAGSPSCPHFAENVVKDLVKKGLLPMSYKKTKITL